MPANMQLNQRTNCITTLQKLNSTMYTVTIDYTSRLLHQVISNDNELINCQASQSQSDGHAIWVHTVFLRIDAALE